MKKNIADKGIKVLGIDIGKNTFHLHGINQRGKVVYRRKLSRKKLMENMVQIPPCTVAMEACGGAHHLMRRLKEFGHDVRLIAPQFVKPFVKSNKNDSLDAEAISEAALRPNMRFVPPKSVAQQDLQLIHRFRETAMKNRTQLINQARGALIEFGIIIPKGAKNVRLYLPEILEDADNELSFEMREELDHLRGEIVHVDDRIARYDAKIKAACQSHEVCRLLLTIPGVGPIVATAMAAAVGDVSIFRSGREMSAWLGLVPRQHSTGGKAWLLGISKRGNTYLRTVLIHGARAALRAAKKKTDRRSCWATDLAARRGNNRAAVALANKNVRIAWALLSKNEEYKAAA